MRILVFGDSIAQGFWDVEGGWVSRLRRHFDSKGVADKTYDHPLIFNLGVSADTTRDLLKRMESEIKARARENMIIVLSIGVNDSQVVGQSAFMTVDEYTVNIAKLLSIVKRFTNKILCVGLSPVVEQRTTPVSWIDISYTNERLKLFDVELENVCIENAVEYIPIFNALYTAQQTSEHMTDGLHPDNNGHQVMLELILPEIEKLVS